MTHVYDPAKRRAELAAIVQQFLGAIECYGSVIECSKLLSSGERNEHARGWHVARVYGDLGALRREARNLLHELDAIEGSTK